MLLQSRMARVKRKVNTWYYVTYEDWWCVRYGTANKRGAKHHLHRLDREADAADWAQHRVMRVLCSLGGHQVVDDQCRMPAHRYCIDCQTRFPNGMTDRMAPYPWVPTQPKRPGRTCTR